MGYVMKGVQGGHQCAGLLKSLTGRLVEQIDDRKRGREENGIGQNRKSQKAKSCLASLALRRLKILMYNFLLH